MELATFESKIGKSVYMTELYDFLELKRKDYSRFCKKNLLENIYCEIDVDFFATNRFESTGKQGNYRQEYAVSVDFAKKICMVTKNKKSNEINDWLVELTKKVENYELLNSTQIIELIRLVKIFYIYEMRKEKTDDFLNNEKKESVYVRFNNWRDEVLSLGYEVLSIKVFEYCVLEHGKIPKHKDEMLCFLNEYEQIKFAVWDLLSSQNKSKELIENISNLAQELAIEMKPFLRQLNESDLFFDKIPDAEVKKVLPNYTKKLTK